jgi:murein DD-endopeptidase / murein LD-carboxypeptidase
MPGEPFPAHSCHACAGMISDDKNIATVKKRIAFYVIGLFSLVLMAATIGSNQDLTNLEATNSFDAGIGPNARIVAFKKGGAQKKINVRDYDIEEVIEHAKSFVGTPHSLGGYSSRGIDCSGLVKLAHAKADVDLPRSSHDQARYGAIILPGEELQRGDLVFFHSTYKKGKIVTHTGIYLGNDEFIHASSKLGVTVSNLNSDYYRKHYLFATRLGS